MTQDLAESIYFIPTKRRCPSSFLHSLDNSHSGPRLISPDYDLEEDCPQTLLPLLKVAYTFGSSVHLRPDWDHINAPFASIAPGTQNLTHSSGRQGHTHVINS